MKSERTEKERQARMAITSFLGNAGAFQAVAYSHMGETVRVEAKTATCNRYFYVRNNRVFLVKFARHES